MKTWNDSGSINVKRAGIIIGLVLIIVGIGLFAYYGLNASNAQTLLAEGKIVFERGNREAVNDALNIFTRVIARYPGTDAEIEANFYLAQGYEKLNMKKQAYYRYVYLLKNNRAMSSTLSNEVRARVGRLKVQHNYTEEGVHQLLALLNQSTNREFRSRVYSEIGHAHLGAGAYQKARSMFEIALTENGDNEEALLGKARSLVRLGLPDSAYGSYEHFFKYYGNFSPYAGDVRRSYAAQVYRSAHAAYRAGRYDSAIGYFNRILRNAPGDHYAGRSVYWIGESYLGQGNYDAAIKYFGRAMEFGGHRAEDARMKRGYTYFQAKRYDLAAREFQAYLSTYPTGRFAATARRWKEMSSQEMLNRIQNQRYEPNDEELEKERLLEEEERSPEPKPRKSGMSGSYQEAAPEGPIHEEENIAEL